MLIFKDPIEPFVNMQLIEVTDKATAQDFIKVNVLMNQSNPKYIRPLNNEVNEAFDPAKNKAFKHGTAKRWILKMMMVS